MNRIYQCITNNNNAGYVADVSFWEFGSSFGTFKQTLENTPKRLWFKRCCNENLLKKLKIEQPVTFKGLRMWQRNFGK